MAKYLTPAQQEIRSLLNEADVLSRRTEPNKADAARSAYIYAKIKALQNGVGTVDYRKQFFGDLFSGREVRDVGPLQAGQQSITYTQGLEGGFFVPQEYHDEVIAGMAQFDPLLNKDIVTLIESDNAGLRPYTVPGWDLSTFAAVKQTENTQQAAQTPPLVAGTILGGFKYMASLPITLELEEDMYEATQKLMSDAYQIAFARGIGIDLVEGDGVTGPQGVATGASPVYTLAANGIVSLNDIEAIYFKVNRFHRASPKCAWLMNDAAYQMTRKAIDTVGNPLLKVIKDKEVLMGKPVYVCPSLPAYNGSLGTQQHGSFCVFGDLSHMFVRVSKLIVKRNTQAAGYIENGKVLYTGIMRADAKVFDPTVGNVPPIVSAALHE